MAERGQKFHPSLCLAPVAHNLLRLYVAWAWDFLTRGHCWAGIFSCVQLATLCDSEDCDPPTY